MVGEFSLGIIKHTAQLSITHDTPDVRPHMCISLSHCAPDLFLPLSPCNLVPELVAPPPLSLVAKITPLVPDLYTKCLPACPEIVRPHTIIHHGQNTFRVLRGL